MKTVILCGGMGTRIRALAEDMPKPMLSIGGQPILWHVMKIYGHQGFDDFVLCLGYKGHVIKDFFLNYHARQYDITVDLSRPAEVRYHREKIDESWRVTLADTGLNTMTGSRVAKVRQYLAGEPDFFLTYGDGLAPIDLRALLAFHRAHGKLATVTGVRPAGRFGEMQLDGEHVRAFAEKPLVTSGRINGGFFVLRQEFIDRYLPADRDDTVLERDALPRAAEDGELVSFSHDGYWQCMDTFREYQILNELWANGAPWKVW